MTADLADFIASPEGEMYGRYCEHYSVHPGAIFDDDVLKFQAGMAYMLRDQFASKKEQQEEAQRKGFLTDEDFA